MPGLDRTSRHLDVNRGLIHTYTGDGKGKTTCAAGLSVRAKSRGLSVLFVQFMKEGAGGETDLLKRMGIEVMRFEDVLSPYFNPTADAEKNRESALRAMDALAPVMKDFDLIVLDEFTHLLSCGLITEEQARGFIEAKPTALELVLTGRGAPGWLLELSDLVTEMKDIKHPSRNGITNRKGIEY